MRGLIRSFLVTIVFLLFLFSVNAAENKKKPEGRDVENAEHAPVKIPDLKYPIRYGIKYLYHYLRNDDGSYGSSKRERTIYNGVQKQVVKRVYGTITPQPMATALALQAITSVPEKYRLKDGPIVRQPYFYLEKFHNAGSQTSGWFVDKTRGVLSSAVALISYKRLFPDEKFEKEILYLRSFKNPGNDLRDPLYGGYSETLDKKPSMDTTFRVVLALQAAGLKTVDLEHVAVFASKCQKMSDNVLMTTGFAKSAGEGNVDHLNTYQGLYLLLAGGVSRDDRRVIAAWNWVKRNYSLNSKNCPRGVPLPYYYYCMAKAFEAYGTGEFETVADRKNAKTKHNWAAEIGQRLVSLHREEKNRQGWFWHFGSQRRLHPAKWPILRASSYAILAMVICHENLTSRKNK